MNRDDASSLETPPRQCIKIGEPLAGSVRRKALESARIIGAVRGNHVGTDFEGLRPDCGAQPGEYGRGRADR